MDSDTFINENIWNYFKNEFYDSNVTSFYGTVNRYKIFIENLDLGITTVSGAHNYRITDHKKWLLAKIKYGF